MSSACVICCMLWSRLWCVFETSAEVRKRICACVSMRVFRLDEMSTAFCHTCVRSVWPTEVSTVVGFTGVCVCVCVCVHLCVFDLSEMSIGGWRIEAAPDELQFVQITHWVKSREKQHSGAVLNWDWPFFFFFKHPSIASASLAHGSSTQTSFYQFICPSIHSPICLFPFAVKGSAWMCWQAYQHLTQVIYTSLTANASCHLFVCYNADVAPQVKNLSP